MQKIDGENGFEVGIRDEYSGYVVQLPHQCDEWVAAWGSKEESVARMEAFVAEAQAALASLRELD